MGRPFPNRPHQRLRHPGLLAALIIIVATARSVAQEAELPTRRGRFLARNLKVAPAREVSIITDVSGNPLALGSVDVSVTIVNESGEDWRGATFDVNLFDAAGALIQSLGRDYALRINVPIGNGEEKTVRFRNLAIFLPGGTTELSVSRSDISLPQVVARAQMIRSGANAGFLAKNRACLEEFLRVSKGQSLEAGVSVTDLLQPGCGAAFESPIHGMVTNRDGGFVQVTIAEGKFFGETGWVPEAWVK